MTESKRANYIIKIFSLFARLFYRLRTQGVEHIPESGPALLVANRLSRTDIFFLLSISKRPIHFLIPERIYAKKWVRPFADLFGVVPITTTEHPAQMLKEYKVVGTLLDQGELVCVFPEESVPKEGVMLSLKRSVELLLMNRSCPVLPVYVDNLWGGIFDDRLGRRVTRHFPYPVSISVSEPLDSRTPISEILRTLQALGHSAWEARKDFVRPIHYGFVKNARRRPFRKILADEKTKKVSLLKTLIGSVVIARKMKSIWDKDEFVGILLPQTIASVLANCAATLSGKASVNLNFSTGSEGIASSIEQAGIKTIITSRQFLEKVSLDLPEGPTVLFLEDLVPKISKKEKIQAALLALFAPIRLLEKACGAKKKIETSDPLTIIFTSGSTGHPKGVVLTHYNVGSNTDAISQIVLTDNGKEATIAVLPFFHSFGYMLLWLGMNYRMELILHPNPMDYTAIGNLIEKHNVSIVITTPTFLRGYLKKVEKRQMRSVRAIMTGAERMPRLLAKAMEEKFDITPIEGYGTSECSPVISANVIDCRKASKIPFSYVPESVGLPLPGVMVKVVDPETFEELPYEIPGMLLVKGPNVMSGYLNRDDLTEQAIRDGWYVTGDIAFVDAQGYIHITDRLSRFSKIGGEMVPHCRVEDALHHAAQMEPTVFAVTSVPDKRKGESLAVLHTFDKKKVKDLVGKLQSEGLPNLFIPKPDHFIKIKEMPLLGNGKLDLKKLKQVAHESLA